MNVLILTPDRVGSTLLQRVLTIYMLRKEFDRPVINLHELTNGLIKYYNETMNREVLGKPEGTKWGYFQTLAEVEELLKTANHYKTSRLAHYHIVNRQDSISDQIKFYEYLNKDFFIISCRRENLFEHVLSWGINGHSKKLNVYSIKEKINSFTSIYQNGITIPKESIINYLTKYKKYIEWSDRYFNIQSYFNYDTDVHNIEEYILNLDFMKGSTNNTWEDMFGQNFDDYNACHRLLPNLLMYNHSVIAPDKVDQLNYSVVMPDEISKSKWDYLKGVDWPEYEEFNYDTVSPTIKKEISTAISTHNIILPTPVKTTKEITQFLDKNLLTYQNTSKQIDALTYNGFLVTTIPIKLQSFKEKKAIISNFDDCAKWYNEWVNQNNFGKLYNPEDADNIITTEEEKLNAPIFQQNRLQ